MQLAKDALHAWLRDPEDVERAALDKDAITHAKSKNSWYAEKKTDQDWRQTSDYKEYMMARPTAKQVMVKELTDQVIAHYKTEVTRLVHTDPAIQEMKVQVADIVRERFPKLIHDVLTLHFAANLDRAVNQAIGNVIPMYTLNNNTGEHMKVGERAMLSDKLDDIFRNATGKSPNHGS